MAVIIYPPTIDWGWMTQRPQQLMRQFAEDGHEVYYCNKTQSSKAKYSSVAPNITVVHNNKEFLRYGIPSFKKQRKEIIVWVTCAMQFQLVEQYLPNKIVFDYVDDFRIWAPYVYKMASKADIIFTTARLLKKGIAESAPFQPCYLVPNACDLNHFQQYTHHNPPKRPLEYEGHNGKIITYVGAYARWVDQELIERISLAFPDALLSIIGPEFGATFQYNFSNVIYSGLQKHSKLPAYLYYADACIIPFKKNSITLSTNPVKMYEYLAATKPVISTDLPEVMDIPYVYTATDHDSFIDEIDKVLSPSFSIDKEKLNSWLSNHTWNKRYEQIKSKLKIHFP